VGPRNGPHQALSIGESARPCGLDLGSRTGGAHASAARPHDPLSLGRQRHAAELHIARATGYAKRLAVGGTERHLKNQWGFTLAIGEIRSCRRKGAHRVVCKLRVVGGDGYTVYDCRPVTVVYFPFANSNKLVTDVKKTNCREA
jgi:hypothetical protein